MCTNNVTKVFVLMISVVSLCFGSLDTVIKMFEVKQVSYFFLEFSVSLTMEFHSFSVFTIDVTILGICVTVKYRKGKEKSRSRWPRCLRRGSAAPRLQRLRV
jgi:hypothetical protein